MSVRHLLSWRPYIPLQAERSRSICVQIAHRALLNLDSLLSQTSATFPPHAKLTSQLLSLNTRVACLTDNAVVVFFVCARNSMSPFTLI